MTAPAPAVLLALALAAGPVLAPGPAQAEEAAVTGPQRPDPQASDPQTPGSQTSAEAAGFARWLQDFRTRALAGGIAPAVYDREMRTADWLPEVVARDRNQTETARSLPEYLQIAVSEARLAGGRAALDAHAGLLAEIEARHGVPKEVIVAIWGLESAYGTRRGEIDTISALATLAHDGRRAALFQDQLVHALRILQGGHVARAALRGSWAGAMGHVQFMPSSWATDAVDFDGDGRRDIWGDDPADALASAAAYLRQRGWQPGLPWATEVRLPQGFDPGLTGRHVVKPGAAWQALGVQPLAGGALPQGAETSVLLPAGAGGPAFLITANFRVIETYNRAEAYVFGIGHLADRLAGGPPVQAPWPKGLRALTAAERQELQERLTAAGFAAGAADGLIGPNTLAALRAWQRARGLPADGFAGPAALAALRAEQG